MSRASVLAVLVAFVLLGFALRVYRLDAVPLRGDEAFSVVNWARQPLVQSLVKTAAIEPHPPLAYALFRGWGLLVGTSEFTMRLLPGLFNVLGVPALCAIGRRLVGWRVGLLAALLWVVHPYEIWHAQDARNYGIWAGLSVVVLWLGLRAVGRRRWVDWLLYGVAALVAVQVYYLELFVLVALGMSVLIGSWGDWRLLARLLAVQAFVVGVAVFSFALLQGRLFASGGYGGTAGEGLDVPRLFTWFVPTLAFGKTLPGGIVAFLWPAVLVVLVLGLAVIWLRDRAAAWLLGWLSFFPLVLIGLVSLRLNVFEPHYVLPVVSGYVLIFSALVLEVRGVGVVAVVRRFLSVALLVCWLVVALFGLYNYFFVSDYTKAANWPALTTYLRNRLHPNDLVIQTAADAAFGFYYDAPNDDIALPANPEQSPEEIVAILEKDSKRYRSIWLVGQTFPDWPNAGVVERWMRENMQPVRSTQTSGLRIEQYMTWEVSDTEIETTPLATFGDAAELVGIQVFAPPEPSGELTVWAYWRPLHTTDTPLKVFVHLIGATNPATGTPLWTQDDQFPQSGRINTTEWEAGNIYRDVYVLPIQSMPAGDYTVVIGFYDPQSGERLLVNNSDSYTVQSIHLP